MINIMKPIYPLGNPRQPCMHLHVITSYSIPYTQLYENGMVQRGHPDETIRKVLGGNVLRVAEAVFAAGAFAPA